MYFCTFYCIRIKKSGTLGGGNKHFQWHLEVSLLKQY